MDDIPQDSPYPSASKEGDRRGPEARSSELMTLEQMHRLAERARPEDPARAVLVNNHGQEVPVSMASMGLALRRPATVTIALLAANVLLYLAAMALAYLGDFANKPAFAAFGDAPPENIAKYLLGANLPASANLEGQHFRLLIACFLHQGIAHLVINMIGLWSLGKTTEVFFGRQRYLLIYICSGLAGSLLSHHLNQQGMSVGASGALFGLLGATIVFPFRAGNVLPKGVTKRLVRQIAPWLVFNLVITFTVPIIDVGGHIGGLLAGGFLALFMGSPTLNPWRLKQSMVNAFSVLVGLLTFQLLFEWVRWLNDVAQSM